jgi:hypothetical protein
VKHEHDWRPLIGWQGRYRCESCAALGYRGLINLGASAMEHPGYDSMIITYKCQKKGCRRAAIGRKPQRCAEHSKINEILR